MPTETTRDVIAEVRELLAAPDRSIRNRYALQLLTALADECERLRQHVKDLEHDFDACVKEANDAEETMLRKLYGR